MSLRACAYLFVYLCAILTASTLLLLLLLLSICFCCCQWLLTADEVVATAMEHGLLQQRIDRRAAEHALPSLRAGTGNEGAGCETAGTATRKEEEEEEEENGKGKGEGKGDEEEVVVAEEEHTADGVDDPEHEEDISIDMLCSECLDPQHVQVDQHFIRSMRSTVSVHRAEPTQHVLMSVCVCGVVMC